MSLKSKKEFLQDLLIDLQMCINRCDSKPDDSSELRSRMRFVERVWRDYESFLLQHFSLNYDSSCFDACYASVSLSYYAKMRHARCILSSGSDNDDGCNAEKSAASSKLKEETSPRKSSRKSSSETKSSFVVLDDGSNSNSESEIEEINAASPPRLEKKSLERQTVVESEKQLEELSRIIFRLDKIETLNREVERNQKKMTDERPSSARSLAKLEGSDTASEDNYGIDYDKWMSEHSERQRKDPESRRRHHRPTLERPAAEKKLPSSEWSDWMREYDNYVTQVHANRAIDKREKFETLLRHLDEQSAKLVEHLDVCEENYDEAWELVQQDFRAKELQYHVARVFSHHSVPPTNEWGRVNALIDEFAKDARAIKRLQEPTDGWDRPIVSFALSKLGDIARKRWELILRNGGECDWESFEKFLREHRALMQTFRQR